MSRVMIVEDEPITAVDLEEKLTHLGHEVTWFETRTDAIAHAQSSEVDLVLMDVRLRGELSGFDAAQQLRAHRDVPIVFLTALADRDAVDRVCSAQPYGYMLKPFTDRTLAAAIQVAMTR